MRLIWATFSIWLCAVPAASQSFTGIWHEEGDCGTDGLISVIAAGHEILIAPDFVEAGPITIDEQDEFGWHRFTYDDWIMFARFPNGTDSTHQTAWPTGAFDNEETTAAMREGRLAPGSTPDLAFWELTTYDRCDALPAEAQLIFGELTALLFALDTAMDVCEDPGTDLGSCAEELFAALEVRRDGRLVVAEMARIVRALTLYVSTNRDDAQMAGVAAGQAAALPLGPVVAATLLHSFDYDSDGTLVLEELAFDRIAPDTDLAFSELVVPQATGALGEIVKDLQRELLGQILR